MDSTMTNPTTSDLTRRVAHVIAALAGYEHLPALGHISVFASGTVSLSPRYDAYGEDSVRDVCVWAAAFDVPVVLDLSSTGRVVAVVSLGGINARLSDSLSHQQAYEYGAALGVPVSPGGQVQVDPAALLAALDARNGAAA